MSSLRISRFAPFKFRNRSLVVRKTSALTSHLASLIASTEPSPPRTFQHSQLTASVQSNCAGTASIVIIATTLVLISIYPYHRQLSFRTIKSDNISEPFSASEGCAIMAGSALPGRPGNLTAEQEARLQEMWTSTLSMFGVPVPVDSIKDDAVSTAGSEEWNPAAQRALAQAAMTSEKKQKKKRIGMFSRKHEDGTASEHTDGVSVMNGNDKYGQAEDYHKLLDCQSPGGLRKAFWSMVKHDDPDGLLLRFLRARKWIVKDALIMLVAAMHWRTQDMHVDDDIIRRGEAGALEDSMSSNATIKKDGKDFLAQMRLGKSFLHGTDREGRPMCFVRVRLHKQGEQTESSLERYTVYTIETARYLLSENVDTAVSQALS